MEFYQWICAPVWLLHRSPRRKLPIILLQHPVYVVMSRGRVPTTFKTNLPTGRSRGRGYFVALVSSLRAFLPSDVDSFLHWVRDYQPGTKFSSPRSSPGVELIHNRVNVIADVKVDRGNASSQQRQRQQQWIVLIETRGAPENLVLFPRTLGYPTDAIRQTSVFNARALRCLTMRRVNSGEMRVRPSFHKVWRKNDRKRRGVDECQPVAVVSANEKEGKEREEITLLLVTHFRIFSSFRSQSRRRASLRCVLGKYILSDSNAHF